MAQRPRSPWTMVLEMAVTLSASLTKRAFQSPRASGQGLEGKASIREGEGRGVTHVDDHSRVCEIVRLATAFGALHGKDCLAGRKLNEVGSAGIDVSW